MTDPQIQQPVDPDDDSTESSENEAVEDAAFPMTPVESAQTSAL